MVLVIVLSGVLLGFSFGLRYHGGGGPPRELRGQSEEAQELLGIIPPPPALPSADLLGPRLWKLLWFC